MTLPPNLKPGDTVGRYAKVLSVTKAKLPVMPGNARKDAGVFPCGRAVVVTPSRVLFQFSLPVRLLSPNAGSPGKWREKAASRKAHRTVSGLETANAVQLMGLKEPWPVATIQAAFYWPDLRKRDADNAIASLKAYLDGLRDGGLIAADDTEHLRHLPATFDIDRACPRVELTIERL